MKRQGLKAAKEQDFVTAKMLFSQAAKAPSAAVRAAPWDQRRGALA